MSRSSGPIRIAILEDQRLHRELLAALLGPPEFSVVLSAATPEEFWRGLEDLPPDAAVPSVAIVDLVLRSESGDPVCALTMLKRLSQERSDWAAVVMSTFDDEDVVRASFAAGARGFVPKGVGTLEGFKEAIRAVARGSEVFPFEMARHEPRFSGDALKNLTPREREVLSLIAAGADNLKIAAVLGITERTVKAHVSALYDKLQLAENRAQLALLARDLGVSPRSE